MLTYRIIKLTSLVRVLGLFLLTTCTTLAAEQAPNVVFVITDDQGQGIIRQASQARGRRKKSAKPTKFNGHWAVHVARTGDYVFEVRRWPEESELKIREGVEAHPVTPGCLPSYSVVRGTALPVVSATLRIDGKDLKTKPVGEDDESVRFTHRLTKGEHKFSPYFSLKPVGNAAAGHELGCYYLTVTLLK